MGDRASTVAVAGLFLAALTTGVASSCKSKGQALTPRRLEVRRMSADTVELVPGPDQLPYCLVFTRSKTGVLRQLTMGPHSRSVDCPVGQRIMDVKFHVPPNEGMVTIYTIFSDQKLEAQKLAEQLLELVADRPTFTGMDLRAPGKVSVDIETFVPNEETPAVTGSPVAGDGGVDAGMDAGTASTDAGVVTKKAKAAKPAAAKPVPDAGSDSTSEAEADETDAGA